MPRYTRFRKPMPAARPRPDVPADPSDRNAIRQVAEWPIAEVTFDELRKMQGFTQVELAAVLGVTQPSLSQLERGRDARLSTITKYVHALGGTLRLVAELPDGRQVQLTSPALA